MNGTTSILCSQASPVTSVRRALRGAIVATAVITGVCTAGSSAPTALAADGITGPASVMDVFAELRRHRVREYGVDGTRGSTDLGRELRRHHDREYGR
jgi:hypothetical protein